MPKVGRGVVELRAARLDWTETPPALEGSGAFDIVVMCDLLYSLSLHAPLLRTLAWLEEHVCEETLAMCCDDESGQCYGDGSVLTGWRSNHLAPDGVRPQRRPRGRLSRPRSPWCRCQRTRRLRLGLLCRCRAGSGRTWTRWRTALRKDCGLAMLTRRLTVLT